MSVRACWYIANSGVYMFPVLTHLNDKPEYDAIIKQETLKVCEPSQRVHWFKIAHGYIRNNLAAKYRLPFYLHNVCEACCAWSVSTRAVNVDHAHLERAGNAIRWQIRLISTFHNQRLGRNDISGVLGRWGRPFANYSLRNPQCVPFGLRAVPTQMFTGMKCCDDMVAALWPLECAFKGDSQAAWICL